MGLESPETGKVATNVSLVLLDILALSWKGFDFGETCVATLPVSGDSNPIMDSKRCC